MRIAIITIGDELLNGDLADTNTASISRALRAHSYPVNESACVGDCEIDIIAALQRLATAADVVICTGGLGPTEDDRTAKAAAKAFNRPLSLNDKALMQIQARFRAWGRDMHPRNEKQALLPNRCSVIANVRGTAPGFALRHGHADLYFLPGVPAEMLTMLQQHIIPAIEQRWPTPPPLAQRAITVYGLPEPEVETRVQRAGLPTDISVGFNVDFPFVVVKLRNTGPDSDRLVDRAEVAVRQVLDDYLIGVDDETLAGNTARFLRIAGLTLALAESCTGGLIAKLLTDHPGVSEFLDRSLVTYANSAKIDLLGVGAELIEQYGAVSNECAQAMARGVRLTAGADIGLAVTGIAGPDGGTAEKPVGTVFIAMDTGQGCLTEHFHYHGDREQIRLRTACTALDWLRRFAIESITKKTSESLV